MASIEFKIENDNTEEIIKMSREAARKALTEIGLLSERYAKQGCVVDTGLLRNSITFALDGEAAYTGEYKADRGGKTGAYSGAAPKEGAGSNAVYVGSNVEYAPYVELGTSKQKAKPFLRPAIQDHSGEFEAVVKKNMENA